MHTINDIRDTLMKKLYQLLTASIFLFPIAVHSSPTINIEKLAEKYKNKLLTPEDVKAGISVIEQSQFPLSWKEVSYGNIKRETRYRYLFFKQQDTKIYYQLELDGELITHTRYFIEHGLEHTQSDTSISLDAGMRNGCIFVIGDCDYPYIKSQKTLTTTFKDGVWTSSYPNGTGKGVITSIYDKNGLIIYRHTNIKNSIQYFESETFRNE